MAKSFKIRNGIQEALSGAPGLAQMPKPMGGWIRSIREALGMSGRQLAERLRVKPPRITEMEKAESTGSISLKSLRKAADALDCELVYALIPKSGLETTLRTQAAKALNNILMSVSHTMRLEEQSLSVKEETKQASAKIEEWVADPPRWLWDVK